MRPAGFRRRCAWPGYWLVVRPVGFPAALRWTGYLLMVRPVGWVARARHLCRPGKLGARCEKSPYFRTSSYLEYGGEGIDSLRSPLLGPSMGLAPSGPTQRCSKRSRRFVGQPAYCVRGLPNWLRQLSNPVGVLIPNGEYKRKSPYFRTSSHLEYGGEGIDSLRSPLQPAAFAVCPTGCASCRTVGVLIPCTENIKKRARTFVRALISNMAVRGFEPRYVAVYTLSGVLLQPLGHLTILSCCSPWVGNGRYYRELR